MQSGFAKIIKFVRVYMWKSFFYLSVMQSSTFSQKPGKDLSGLGIEMVYVDHIF